MRINAMTRWLYDQRTSSEIQLRGGETVAQFNESGIGPLSNTVHSLLLELNGLKIYDKKFAEIKWTREIFNGFYLTAATGYEQRTALNNLSGIQPGSMQKMLFSPTIMNRFRNYRSVHFLRNIIYS